METEKDQELWYIAKKRVSFKRQLAAYLLMNTMFWFLWYFTESRLDQQEEMDFPWPVWPMLGWGIGLAFAYMKAYVYPKSNAVEREYQKLKNK